MSPVWTIQKPASRSEHEDHRGRGGEAHHGVPPEALPGAPQAEDDERDHDPSVLTVVGAAYLVADDPALLEGDDALAERRDDLGVVGRHQDGDAELVDPQQELEDLPADERVEVAGRLVGDDQARVVDERPGDRRPLLLAARQLVGSWRAWAVSPTSASTRSTAGRISRRGVPVTSRANATFSQTLLVGQQLEVLEDDADLAPDLGHLRGAAAGRGPGRRG